MRFSMRFANNTVNLDPDTNTIFFGMHNTYNLGLSSVSKNSYEEVMKDFTMEYIIYNFTNRVRNNL